MLAALRSLVVLLVIVPMVGSVAQASASSSTGAATGTARVLVRFDADTSTAAQNALLARVGAHRIGTISQLGIAVVGVPARSEETAVHELDASPIVAYIERDGRVQGNGVSTDDPYLNSSYWPISNLRLPDAWSLSSGSESVIVAVLDSGVDRRHEDFGAFVTGHNFVSGGANTSDNNGHGTAVAGTIAAQGGNGKGISGVCWKCKIMPVKVLGADNTGSWSDVADGVIWATKHGAQVINLSLGMSEGSRSIADAVSYAVSHNVIVVAAAGNENSSAPDYPAAYSGVLSVGAVDETGTRYSTSNGNVKYGKWGSNYGSWVDVDAPGCGNSTWPADSSRPSGNYTYFCGTSAATPYVAGVAALALSYVPTASATDVINAIETTAHQTADKNSAHGLIDAAATLEALSSSPPTTSTSSTTSSTASSTTTTSSDAGSVTTTLAKISARMTKKAFSCSRAQTVKVVYRFSAPSTSFSYRLEHRNRAAWHAVRTVKNLGNFQGSHKLTIKQLFGGATIASGEYRLVLRSDVSLARVGFVTK